MESMGPPILKLSKKTLVFIVTLLHLILMVNLYIFFKHFLKNIKNKVVCL